MYAWSLTRVVPPALDTLPSLLTSVDSQVSCALPVNTGEEFVLEIYGFNGRIIGSYPLCVLHKHILHLLHRVFQALRHTSYQTFEVLEGHHIGLHGYRGHTHLL